MIETTASKSFANSCSRGAVSPPQDASTQRGGYNFLTWLNLVCLDAPIVAVSWMWLFARNFGIPISYGGTAALFLTAWLIYLADRYADGGSSAPSSIHLSLRQRFCLEHRTAWLTTLFLVGIADLLLICTQLGRSTIFAGAVVGLFALVYLFVNQLRPSVWRRLPLKEICIGFLFAAGTVLPLANGLTRAIVPSWFLFAGLCSINCISIAVWERELDLAQGRVSIAITFPIVGRFVLPLTNALCLTSGAFGARELAASSALLAGLHIFKEKIQSDVRTALADLVLLTPIVTRIFA